MTSNSGWYQVTAGEGLEQGDLLPRCPVHHIPEIPDPTPSGVVPTIQVFVFDLVVMSQSCDLLNDKLDTVLLAQAESWPDFVRANAVANPYVKSREYRKKLVDGVLPGFSLINKHEGDPALPWSVVNFHRLFVLPKPYVRSLASARSPHLRLRPPYLEHLSQAFARYFMRVGLPHPLHEFIQDGDAG